MEEPTLSEVILDTIDARLDDVMTCTVGKIQSYDPETQTANVIPMMRRTVTLAPGIFDYEELPVIPNVQVMQPRAGKFYIHLPVNAGDYVALSFTHDDISNWRDTGEAAEPDDLRRHGLGSCVAHIGMAHSKMPLTNAPVEMNDRNSGIVIGVDGTPLRLVMTETGITIGELAVSPIVLSVPLLAYLAEMASAIQALSDTNTALASIVGTLVPATGSTATPAQIAAAATAASAGATAAGAVATPPTLASTIVKSL